MSPPSSWPFFRLSVTTWSFTTRTVRSPSRSVEDRIRLVRSPGPGAKGGIDRDGENDPPRFERKGGHWRRARARGKSSSIVRAARGARSHGRRARLLLDAAHTHASVARSESRTKTQRRTCACHSSHDGFTRSSTTPPPWSLCPTSPTPWSLCPTSQNGGLGLGRRFLRLRLGRVMV